MGGDGVGRVGWVVFAVIAPSWVATAGETPRIDYVRDVKPVFARRCYACHGAWKQKAHLRVGTVASLRKGGDAGPAVEPGKADESELIGRVTQADPKIADAPRGIAAVV